MTNEAHEAQSAPLTAFTLSQRITMMVNRYEVRTTEGQLLAMAQQKRMAFKEQVTFYSDEARTQPLFGFKARKRLDLGATYDVTDASGQPIGWFKKDFGKSLFRSTWHVGVPGQGLEATGHERNRWIAAIRRIWDMVPILGDIPVPWQFHFDFTTPDGIAVMSSQRRIGMRDRYDITLPTAPNGAVIDWRVGAAVAVALDALQGR